MILGIALASPAPAAEGDSLTLLESRPMGGATGRIDRVTVVRDEPQRLTLDVVHGGLEGLRLAGRIVATGSNGNGHVEPAAAVTLEARRKATIVFERPAGESAGRLESRSLTLVVADEAGQRGLVNSYRLDKVWGGNGVADAVAAVELILDPTPIGSTPDVTKPTPTPTPTPNPGGTTGVGGVRIDRSRIRDRALIMAVLPKIDLFQAARVATWRNATAGIAFGTGNERGGAVMVEKATLGDGKEYTSLISVHPEWKANGTMTAVYAITIPADATSFSTGLGMIQGARASDGVTFDVRISEPSGRAGIGNRWTTLVSERVKPDQVVQRTIALPESVKGKAVELMLTVNAGADSSQDWAVWIYPRVH